MKIFFTLVLLGMILKAFGAFYISFFIFLIYFIYLTFSKKTPVVLSKWGHISILFLNPVLNYFLLLPLLFKILALSDSKTTLIAFAPLIVIVANFIFFSRRFSIEKIEKPVLILALCSSLFFTFKFVYIFEYNMEVWRTNSLLVLLTFPIYIVNCLVPLFLLKGFFAAPREMVNSLEKKWILIFFLICFITIRALHFYVDKSFQNRVESASIIIEKNLNSNDKNFALLLKHLIDESKEIKNSTDSEKVGGIQDCLRNFFNKSYSLIDDEIPYYIYGSNYSNYLKKRVRFSYAYRRGSSSFITDYKWYDENCYIDLLTANFEQKGEDSVRDFQTLKSLIALKRKPELINNYSDNFDQLSLGKEEVKEFYYNALKNKNRDLLRRVLPVYYKAQGNQDDKIKLYKELVEFNDTEFLQIFLSLSKIKDSIYLYYKLRRYYDLLQELIKHKESEPKPGMPNYKHRRESYEKWLESKREAIRTMFNDKVYAETVDDNELRKVTDLFEKSGEKELYKEFRALHNL